MNLRHIEQIVASQAGSDGAGVRLRRYFDARAAQLTDPFLMLDNFGTDRPQDYIAGFPDHPHRGFETVTYMLEGRMRHRDSRGNQGDLGPGDVQWMTAGRGIIHSEMPQQTEGRMQGFQLWINLPARDKLCEPRYQDVRSDQIPEVALAGGRVRVIAGSFDGVDGPVRGVATAPTLLDIHLDAGASLDVALPAGHRAMLAPHRGSLRVADGEHAVDAMHLALLGPGDTLRISAGPEGVAALLAAARPIGEPVAHYGPFVMNTREEIEQAIQDYRTGRLA